MLPEIKTILYCTSLGPHAPYIFGYACTLAKHLDAKIVAVHVIETLNRKQRTLLQGYAGQGRLHELLDDAHQQALAEFPKQVQERLRPICSDSWDQMVSEVLVLEGDTETRIIETITAKSADLVVVGAHTENSILERMIGSTARSLVKKSPIPVLTVQVPEDVGIK
jgi:nucleotide-binding universal stress UspA family protein